MKTLEKMLVGAGLLVPFTSFAASTVDTTAITGAVSDVTAVAAAVFTVYVAIKAAKFVRRAL